MQLAYTYRLRLGDIAACAEIRYLMTYIALRQLQLLRHVPLFNASRPQKHPAGIPHVHSHERRYSAFKHITYLMAILSTFVSLDDVQKAARWWFHRRRRRRTPRLPATSIFPRSVYTPVLNIYTCEISPINTDISLEISRIVSIADGEKIISTFLRHCQAGIPSVSLIFYIIIIITMLLQIADSYNVSYVYSFLMLRYMVKKPHFYRITAMALIIPLQLREWIWAAARRSPHEQRPYHTLQLYKAKGALYIYMPIKLFTPIAVPLIEYWRYRDIT